MPNNIEFYIIIGFFGLIVFSIGLSLLLGAFSILVTVLAIIIKIIKGIFKLISFILTPIRNKLDERKAFKQWERFMQEYPGHKSAVWNNQLKKLVPMENEEILW